MVWIEVESMVNFMTDFVTVSWLVESKRIDTDADSDIDNSIAIS